MLSIGFHAIRRANPAADDRIVIIGLGPIGLGIALAARARGLTTVAIDPSPGRREFALTHRLVSAAQAPGDSVLATARDLCGGQAPDIVLDATGHTGAMEQSVLLPGHGGKVVFVGLVQGNISFSDAD